MTSVGTHARAECDLQECQQIVLPIFNFGSFVERGWGLLRGGLSRPIRYAFPDSQSLTRTHILGEARTLKELEKCVRSSSASVS